MVRRVWNLLLEIVTAVKSWKKWLQSVIKVAFETKKPAKDETFIQLDATDIFRSLATGEPDKRKPMLLYFNLESGDGGNDEMPELESGSDSETPQNQTTGLPTEIHLKTEPEEKENSEEVSSEGEVEPENVLEWTLRDSQEDSEGEEDGEEISYSEDDKLIAHEFKELNEKSVDELKICGSLEAKLMLASYVRHVHFISC